MDENGANSSWNTVSDIKHKRNETEDKLQRFLLKRNNPDTNPESIRKKTSDSERPVQSKHEMMNLLMRGSKKKSKK